MISVSFFCTRCDTDVIVTVRHGFNEDDVKFCPLCGDDITNEDKIVEHDVEE